MVSTRGSQDPGEDVPHLKRLDSASSQDSTATNGEPIRKSMRLREKADKNTDKVSPGGGDGRDSDEENRSLRTGIPSAPARYNAPATSGGSKIPQPTRRGRGAQQPKQKKEEPEIVTLDSSDEDADKVQEKTDSAKTPEPVEIKKPESTENVNGEDEGKSSRRSSFDDQPKTRRSASRATTPARSTGIASAKKSKISEFFAVTPPQPQEEKSSEEVKGVEEEVKSTRGRRSRANTPAKTPAKSKVSTLVIEDIDIEPEVAEKEKIRSTRASSRAREEIPNDEQEPKTPKRGRKTREQPAILHIEDIEVEEERNKKKEEEVPARTTRSTRSSSRAREQASPARSTRSTTPARKEPASPTRLTRAMRKAGMTTPGQEESEEPAKFELAPEQPDEPDSECQIIEDFEIDAVELEKNEVSLTEKNEAVPVKETNPAEEVKVQEEAPEDVVEAPAAEVAVEKTASSDSVDESEKAVEGEKKAITDEELIEILTFKGPPAYKDFSSEKSSTSASETPTPVLPEGPSTARRRGFDTLADRLISQLYTPKSTPAKPASLPSVVVETSTPIPGQGNSSFMDWEACPTPQPVEPESSQQPAAVDSLDIGDADLLLNENKDLSGMSPSKEAAGSDEDEAADDVLKAFKEKKRLSGDRPSSKESSVEVDLDEDMRALVREFYVSDSSANEEEADASEESSNQPKVFDTSLNMEGLLQEREEEANDEKEAEKEAGEEVALEKAESVAKEASSVLTDDEALVIDESSKDSETGYISIEEEAEKALESPQKVVVTVETEICKELVVDEVVVGEKEAEVAENVPETVDDADAKEADEQKISESPAPRTKKPVKSEDDLSNFLDLFQNSPATASSRSDDAETRKLKRGKSVAVVARKETVPEASLEAPVETPQEPVSEESVVQETPKEKKKSEISTPLAALAEDYASGDSQDAVESAEVAESSVTEEAVVSEDVAVDKTETVLPVTKQTEAVEEDSVMIEATEAEVSEVPAPAIVKKTEDETSVSTAVSSESAELEGEKKKKKKKRQSTAPSASSESVRSTEEVPTEVQMTVNEVSVAEVVEAVESEEKEEPKKKKKKRQSNVPSAEVSSEVVSEVPEEPFPAPVVEDASSEAKKIESETSVATAVASEFVEQEGEKRKKKKKSKSLANTQIYLGEEEEEKSAPVPEPPVEASDVAEVEPDFTAASDIPVVDLLSEEVVAIATTPKDKKKKKKKRQSDDVTVIVLGDEEEEKESQEKAEAVAEKEEVVEAPIEETSGVEKKKKKRKKSLAVDSSNEVQDEVKKAKLDDEVQEIVDEMQEAAAEIAEEQVEEPVKEKKKKKKQKKAKAEEAAVLEEAIVPDVVEEKVEEEAEAKKSKKKKKKSKKMVVAPEEEVEVEEAASGAVNYPALTFKKLYAEPELCSSKISAALSALYTWSCQQKRHDDLPETFLNDDDETVYQFVKHKGKQIKRDFRKYQSLLDDPIACPWLEDEEEENDDDEEMDQALEDEEAMELDDEAFAGDEEDEEVDLFNLRGEDLKDLERELAEIDNEDDDEAGTSADKENGEERKPKKQQKKFPKSVVDDKFFNLAEMDAFCDDQEKQNEDEGILATVDDSWGGPADYRYEDFFGKLDDVVGEDTSVAKKTKKRKADDSDSGLSKKKKKSVRFAIDEEEEEKVEQDEEEIEEENCEPEAEEPVLLGKVAIEKAESKLKADIRKLKESIRKLEQENLEPRSWELSGEVTAQQRGENALLDTHLQFDNTSKRAPEVTEDFTEKLEAIIKQRIKDQAFDDVVRIKKVDEKVDVYRNDAIEEMENMKKSLSEVYEKEYQKAAGQVEAASAENEQHKAIQAKVDRLFQLIDAMSHFEYTPPQVRPEIRVVSNMPALRVEEVGMMASTDAQLLAPEEMKKKQKGDLKADEERTSTDKLRQRRKKKVKQRAMVLTMGADKALAGQIEKKIKKKTKKAVGSDKPEESMKSSNFFSKLQDTVQKEMKQKTKKVKSEKITTGGAKFKL